MMSKLLLRVWLAAAPLIFTLGLFAGVQPNGSFSHNIEIKLPPGRAGLQPKLSLSYNSNGDNGILGQGWYLSGIPAITRIQNGKGINYNENDTFAITNFGVKPYANGKLYTSGAPDYFKEIADYVHYRATCNAWYSVSCEPASWTVRDPAGLIMEFGTDANARVADGPSVTTSYTGGSQYRVFALNRVRDLYGNAYEISYIRPSGTGEIYPDVVRYTLGPGIGKNHSIHFIYESRSDSAVDHMGASAYRTVYLSKRLKWIEVRSDGSLVRKYKMFYGHSGTSGTLIDADTYAPSTGRSRLTAVQEYGSDGSSTLPAQVFGYQDGVGVLDTVDNNVASLAWIAGTIGQSRAWSEATIADFNGDGRADLFVIDRIAYSNGAGFSPFMIIPAVPPASGVAMDLNGDGKADLFAGTSANNYIWNATSQRFFDTSLWQTLPSADWKIGDFDGDGRDDLILTNSSQISVWSMHEHSISFRYVYTNNQASYESNPAHLSNWIGSRFVPIKDINGDGKVDIFIPVTGSGFWLGDYFLLRSDGVILEPILGYFPVIGNTHWPTGSGELNGDGKADLISISGCRSFTAWTSIGPSWSFETEEHEFGGYCQAQNTPFFDFNGDSRLDLNLPQSPDEYTRFGDFDGDGKTDKIVLNLSDASLQMTRSTSGTPDLLTSINNGAGGVTTITYKPAPQVPGAVDPSQSNYPVIANSSPRNLVTQVSVSDGRGASYATQYQYHNGKTRTGTVDQRRDLGFEWVREVNAQTGAYTQTWYNQTQIELAMSVVKTESFAGGSLPSATAQADYSRLMSRTSFQYALMPGAFNESTVVRLDTKTNQTYEYGYLVYSQRQRMIYDDFADMMRTVPRYVIDEADGTATVVTELHYAPMDWTNWILNRVTQTITRSGSTSGAILNQTQFLYDSTCGNAHNLCKRNDWLNQPTAKWITTAFAYDAYGNVTDISDALGHISHIEYDADFGTHPVKVRNALGHEIISIFDPKYGTLVSQTEPNGGITAQTLDVFGRVVESRINGQVTQTLVYNDALLGNANGQYIETRVSDAGAPGGYTFARNYFDGLGRTYKKESSGPNLSGTFYTIVTETGFDTAGRKAVESHPYLFPRDLPVFTEYYYDANGRLNYVQYPEGTGSSVNYYFYPAQFRHYVEVLDGNGNGKITARDSRGRVVYTEEGGIATVSNQYDPFGQLTQVTDADGLITTIQYDSLGRKTSMTEPNTGLWSYAYDDAGNLLTQVDAKGQAISFLYDALNRLTDKILPAGGTNVHYTYDDNTVNGIGRLTQINDAAGVMKYSYDTKGNVTAWRQTVMGKTYSFQAAYDLQNRVTRLTYPDGEFTENFYAESGYLRQVRLKNPDKVWGAPVVTYSGPEPTGDADVLELTRHAGNNVVTKIGFDRRTMKAVSLKTKLADAAQTVVEDVTFANDSVGNISAVVDNLNNNKSQTFEYDGMYRLTRANSVAYGNLIYSYSDGGNLLYKEGVTLSYGNPQHPQAVTQAGANTYTYDANANMVSRNGRALIYDAEDRLTQITLAGVAKQTFTYDHSGQRVVKAREDGTVAINLSGLYEVLKLPDNSERHTKYIFGLAGEMVSQITRDGATITLVAQAILNQNNLTLASFHGGGLEGTFLNLYHGADYLFANTKITRKMLLIIFLGICLAVFVIILRSKLRREANVYELAHPRLAKLAPLVLVFAIFEFGFMGCAVGNLNVENATPWSDLPTAPPGTPGDVSDGTQSDTTQAGFPVLGAYFMHPNYVGSPVMITNAAGTQVLTRITYRPYGEVVRNSAYSNGPDIGRYKFTGQEEDAESGLIYMNARFYDPAIGRFITSDSEFGGQGTQGFNRHMYATGNPIKYSDPSGHSSEDQAEKYDMSKADEKGNVPERSRDESAGEKWEKGNRGEQGGSEARAESRAENSSREHVDIDPPDRGDRGAAGASNTQDNSQLQGFVVAVTTSFSQVATNLDDAMLLAGLVAGVPPATLSPAPPRAISIRNRLILSIDQASDNPQDPFDLILKFYAGPPIGMFLRTGNPNYLGILAVPFMRLHILAKFGAGSRATAHGGVRIAGQATRGGVLSETQIISTRWSAAKFVQSDGAVVSVKVINGRYNVVIEGDRGIITTFKNLTEKSLLKLAERYGWK